MASAQQYVPYAYARDHSILLKPNGEREAEVWVGDATDPEALHEVQRAFPGRIRVSWVEADQRRPGLGMAMLMRGERKAPR